MFGINFIASASGVGAFMDRFGINWQLLTVQIVNFLVVSFILYKFAFKPVLQTMDERKKKINEGIELSKRIKLDLIKSNDDCAQLIKNATLRANDLVREAREDAEKLNVQQIAEGRYAADLIIEKAKADIELYKINMLAEVKLEVKSLIIDLSRKVLRRNMSDDEKSKYNQDIVELISEK